LVSFGHCVVRPSSIYGFWWPRWYLLVIMLSVLLRFTAFDDLFGIFWSLCCPSFFDLRLLIDTNGVIKSRKSKNDGQHNDQKIPTGSSKAVNRRRTDNIMTKRYQRGFDLQLLMTPLASFGHCDVRPSSIYGFWWPLWYLLVIVLSVLLKGSSKAVNRRRTDNTMTKRSQRGHQKR
jgi:hypothetical protein